MSKRDLVLKTFHPTTLAQWRAWLRAHHATASDVWLVSWKKHTAKPAVDYGDALDEALCVGWIDSLIRRIDEDRAARRYSPRRPRSTWSPANVARFARLVAEGRMTAAGAACGPTARTKAAPADNRAAGALGAIPPSISRALKRHKRAWANFVAMTPSRRGLYVRWIESAKRVDTRERRLAEAARKLERNETPGVITERRRRQRRR